MQVEEHESKTIITIRARRLLSCSLARSGQLIKREHPRHTTLTRVLGRRIVYFALLLLADSEGRGLVLGARLRELQLCTIVRLWESL